MRPLDGRTTPQRTASVSERIAQRLKEIQSKSGPKRRASPEAENNEMEEENSVPKVDKGKRREIENPLPPVLASPRPMSPLALPHADLPPDQEPSPPAHILVGGISLSPLAVSQLLIRAAAELPLRPVRFPLLGEYQDCFTGDEFVAWLCHNVPDLEGNLDHAEVAAKDLTEREGLLRRLGEFGNQFEPLDDAFYQFRPKVSLMHLLRQGWCECHVDRLSIQTATLPPCRQPRSRTYSQISS